MSSDHYRIDEHVIEASHIRGFPRTTSTTQNEVLHLAVKQYTPLNNPNPQPGDLTIIAAHANAFPKVFLFPFHMSTLSLLETAVNFKHHLMMPQMDISPLPHHTLASIQ
jgi:hypothetical protein